MTRSPTSKQLGFADWLSGLVAKEDRAALAALRRGLLLDEERLFELYAVVPPSFLAGLKPREERLYLTVASLFAYHPCSFSPDELVERRRNLGESLRLLAEAEQPPDNLPDELLPDPLKRRTEALLAAPRDELSGHLRQITGLLKTKEVPVDWAQLLGDLSAWEWEGHPVQWQWGRSFYIDQHEKEGE